MKLIGIRLQEAGLSFLTANGRHDVAAGSSQIDEVVCATQAEADAVNVAFGGRDSGNGTVKVIARVATKEELLAHESMSW